MSRGFYHSMFREFLDQDFMQPCVLTGAIDALLGPQGRLSAAMNRDIDKWRASGCCRRWRLEDEVKFVKAWIRGRLAHLSSAVDEELRGCSGRGCVLPAPADPLTCRMSPADRLQAQCDRVAPPTVCVQGSVGPTCEHNTDLCAANGGSGPCQNGGRCTLAVVPRPGAAVDACGCREGSGWSGSDRECQVGKSTSDREGVTCAQARGGALTTECRCVGGYSGPTCAQPRRGLDACGCALGTGWSKSAQACAEGGTTSGSEAETCGAGGRPGRPSGGTGCADDAGGIMMAAIGTDCAGIVPNGPIQQVRDALCGSELESLSPGFAGAAPSGTRLSAICQVSCGLSPADCQALAAQPAGAVASSSSCDVASLAKLTQEACPQSAPGSWTPSTCPLGCARQFDPWWGRCGGGQAFDAQLAAALGDPDAAAVFSQFAAMCAAAVAGQPDGGGH